MRVAILWTRLSGYLSGCIRALAASGAGIFVANEKAGSDAPYSDSQFAWITNRYEYSGAPNVSVLIDRLEQFAPDVVICAWHIRAFQNACQHLRGRAVRVGGLDNQWRGTPKQWAGRLISPIHLQRYYDALFVPGERQSLWAQKMGFSEERIWRGSLACEMAAFVPISERQHRPDAFLYVGRLSPEKGITTLLASYRVYRARTERPWKLIIAGEGPLRGECEQTEGVEVRGFVQPVDLPNVYGECGCFVMPSTYEPWCVAIHEATAAGCPVICTSECGASVHLVQDGLNGYLLGAGSVEELSRAMSKMSNAQQERRCEMSRISAMLAQQFTPERWARCVIERGTELATTLCIPMHVGNAASVVREALS